MAGVKGKSGGYRPNAGRTTKPLPPDLKSVLDRACPPSKREEIFQSLAQQALDGDVNAAKLILAYAYGTPQSGDDYAVQEKVNKIANDFYAKLAPVFGEERANQILELLVRPSGDGSAEGRDEGS